MTFPRYDTAILLGTQSVVGQNREHLLWHAYATDDAPETVAAFYQRALGTNGLTIMGQETIWRLPAERPVEVLHILPIDADGPHLVFRHPWPASARTAIIVSHLSRP
jgi:hypothetical protein